MSGDSFYSESLDMEGYTRLLVEAWRIDGPRPGPAPVEVHVQGTNDDDERKCWAGVGPAIGVLPGQVVSEERVSLPKTVRVFADARNLESEGRIEVRLTRRY